MKTVLISLGFWCNQTRLFCCWILWSFLGSSMLRVICTFLYLNGIIFEPGITMQKPESLQELRVQQLNLNKFHEYCPLIVITCSYLRTFMFAPLLDRNTPFLYLAWLDALAIQVSIWRPPPQGGLLGCCNLKQPLPILSLYHVLFSSKSLLFFEIILFHYYHHYQDYHYYPNNKYTKIEFSYMPYTKHCILCNTLVMTTNIYWVLNYSPSSRLSIYCTRPGQFHLLPGLLQWLPNWPPFFHLSLPTVRCLHSS